ncbi:hypothetical protein BH24GEM1_BH24GEM1_03120 [soil metagenome]
MNSHTTLAASALVIVLGGSAPTSALGHAAPESVTVTLRPVGNSGVSGEAALHARGRETDFHDSLNAADRANQQREYDVWLRAGSCAAPGRKLEELDDLKADGRQVVACGDIQRAP